MSEYTEQAENFLKRHGLKFTATKTGYGPYWDDDKESRDIYRLRLTRKGKNSPLADRAKLPNGMYAHARTTYFKFGASIVDTERGEAPTAYDLLAGITKSDPGSFEEFCRGIGYDTGSRRAEKTYKAVKKEWAKVQRFFTAEEIAELQEIA